MDVTFRLRDVFRSIIILLKINNRKKSSFLLITEVKEFLQMLTSFHIPSPFFNSLGLL